MHESDDALYTRDYYPSEINPVEVIFDHVIIFRLNHH